MATAAGNNLSAVIKDGHILLQFLALPIESNVGTTLETNSLWWDRSRRMRLHLVQVFSTFASSLAKNFFSRCGLTRIQPVPTRRTIVGHENKTTSVEYRDDLVLPIQLVVETGKT